MNKAGDVEIQVWGDGSPIWCIVRIGSVEARIRDTELSDLIYAARKAQEQANEARRRFGEPPLAV